MNPETQEIKPGYVFHDLQDEGIPEVLVTAPLFKKVGEVSARVATQEEVVITEVDGQLETTNVASPGDFVVTGAQGEVYVLKSDKFNNRYEPIEGKIGVYNPRGIIRAITNPYQENIVITPPWGGYQYGDFDCFIATVVDSQTCKSNNPDDIYLIDKNPFKKSYQLKDNYEN